MPSGERTKAMYAVARRPVDGDARLHQLAGRSVDVVDAIGEVAEIAPALDNRARPNYR